MHIITITHKDASSPGALPGHVATCSCGFSQGSSLGEREAKVLGFAHKAWAEKAGK